MLSWFLNKLGGSKGAWYEPDDPAPREICPCCDYLSLPERGNDLICPICFWEDDGGDVDALDRRSGPKVVITSKNMAHAMRLWLSMFYLKNSESNLSESREIYNGKPQHYAPTVIFIDLPLTPQLSLRSCSAP